MGKRPKKIIEIVLRRIMFPTYIFFLYNSVKCYEVTVFNSVAHAYKYTEK